MMIAGGASKLRRQPQHDRNGREHRQHGQHDRRDRRQGAEREDDPGDRADGQQHGQREQERVADQPPGHRPHLGPQPGELEPLGDRAASDLGHHDALHDDAEGGGGQTQHERGDDHDRHGSGPDRGEVG
ncbi:hypothetical protein [Microbacterium elymi]|uniref:hypothetical protein n=1 Tax=Microbacterium elymi TaxID=2909587 RepID=UPI00338FE8A4